MLALLGFLTVVTFLILIMTKRVSVTLALIVVPVITALIGGFAPKMGPMMVNGIKNVAPVGVMIMFAILYFGLMLEVGLFEPIVKRLLKMVGGDPLKVVLATAFLTCSVALDGDGATTFMITISAMLPLYKALNMSRLVLSGTICLAAGVINIIPWGGPTARAMTVLKADSTAIFNPVIPAMIAGLVWVFFVAWYFGKKERARVGVMDVQHIETPVLSAEESALRRPKLLWFNALLTIVLVVALIQAILPLATLFMIAYAIALIVNFPDPKQQLDRITAQGNAIVLVCSMIFAAGIFTGILSGTGMVEAMSKSLLAVIPEALGPYLAVITALVSMPFTFFMSNDAFYYGVLPVLAEAAGHYGISPVEMARASIVGQPVHLLSPLVPSTYLLVGLAKVEFGDHQRFTLKWAVLICLAILLAALLLGVFPLFGG